MGERTPDDDFRAFPDAADGRVPPPMTYELMAAGLSDDDARFAARQLRRSGYYLVRAEDIGWEQISAFQAEIAKGQAVTEDAGGFLVRAIMRMFGKRPDPVLTYRKAVAALLSAESPK